MSRRSRGKLKRLQEKDVVVQPAEHTEKTVSPSHGSRTNYSEYRLPKLVKFYDKNYKMLLIIPMLILLLAMVQIGYQYSTTGEFMHRGISLKGGTSITFTYTEDIDSSAMEEFLTSKGFSVSVRKLENAGNSLGFMVDADLDFTDSAKVSSLVSEVGNFMGKEITKDDYSVEGVGSSLGESFFKQTIIAVLFAFLFMSIVVFVYFRMLIPSLAVILCAFSDIVVTLAIVNVLDIKLSAAGVAAFLMLIGYSVDSDMVLTTRVLKRSYKTVFDRVMSSFSTGTTMTLTTLVAVTVSLLLINNDVVKQIMTIIFIGLFIDLIMTWIQNVSLLRWYCEKKGIK